MTTTIELEFGAHQACAFPVIPSAEYPAAFTHDDGSVETSMRIDSAEIQRPAGVDGDVVMRLAGDGTIDLCLSRDAAEMIGFALIRATTLPVGDPAQPGIN